MDGGTPGVFFEIPRGDMVLTRGRRRQQAQEEEERAAQRARLERLDWQGQVCGQGPLHHLGYFLDRYDLGGGPSSHESRRAGERAEDHPGSQRGATDGGADI